MKFLVAIVLCFAAFAAYSADLTTTISDIEFSHNARCTKKGSSLFNLCSGSVSRFGEASVPYTCTYTVKYKCESNSKDFGLKLRVREAYNPITKVRESRVTRVIFKH